MGLNNNLAVLNVYAKARVLLEEFTLVEQNFEKLGQCG